MSDLKAKKQIFNKRKNKIVYSDYGILRRDFLIALSAGAAASITGYFLWPQKWDPMTNVSMKEGNNSLRPCMRKDVTLDMLDDMTTLSRYDTKLGPVTCAVNQSGAIVVKLLDGKHTIGEIATEVSLDLRIEASQLLEAKIAYFVSQAGMMGFLQRPFYCCIVENMDA